MKRLLIVQPYIPEYRVPLFRLMKHALEQQGIEMKIAAAVAAKNNVDRGDMSDESEIDFVLKTRSITVRGRDINFRRLAPVISDYKPDFVIAEQVVKNIEIYPIVLRRLFGSHLKLAFWGQGRSFSESQPPWLASMKQMLTKRGDWFFAYTQEGANAVIQRGFPNNKVTVLNNSTDTESLRRDLGKITRQDVIDFQHSLGLTPGMTGLFLGGVDQRKGIDFLLEATKLIHKELPNFRLLVAGEGSESWKVRDLEKEGGPVRFLGRVNGPEKANALECSDALLVPEWIGLVALDSLTSGCPIITTSSSTHSPEFFYLNEGQNCLVSDPCVEAYSQLVVETLMSPKLLPEMVEHGLTESFHYSIEKMADRYVGGIAQWTGEKFE